MADFELIIDEQAFHKAGVRPVFDENLYGQLLDEYAPGCERLTVEVFAHKSLGAGALRSRMYEAFPILVNGYVGGYDEKELAVLCLPDLSDTNNTLLHETKHFFDDMTGAFDASFKRQVEMTRFARYSMFGSAALIGVTAHVTLPLLGLLSAAAPLPIYRHMLGAFYTEAEHEVNAQSFAANAEVVKQYGKIITYEQY